MDMSLAQILSRNGSFSSGESISQTKSDLFSCHLADIECHSALANSFDLYPPSALIRHSSYCPRHIITPTLSVRIDEALSKVSFVVRTLNCPAPDPRAARSPSLGGGHFR